MKFEILVPSTRCRCVLRYLLAVSTSGGGRETVTAVSIVIDTTSNNNKPVAIVAYNIIKYNILRNKSVRCGR